MSIPKEWHTHKYSNARAERSGNYGLSDVVICFGLIRGIFNDIQSESDLYITLAPNELYVHYERSHSNNKAQGHILTQHIRSSSLFVH